MLILSLTNLQVTIGGQNVLQSVISYNYESFLEQVLFAEQLTSADFGVSTGVFDAAFGIAIAIISLMRTFNHHRKTSTRNLNISFTNKNNVPIMIDVLIFTFKSNSLTLDCETGIVSIP